MNDSKQRISDWIQYGKENRLTFMMRSVTMDCPEDIRLEGRKRNVAIENVSFGIIASITVWNGK